MEDRETLTDKEYLERLETGRQEKLSRNKNLRTFAIVFMVVFALSLIVVLAGIGGDSDEAFDKYDAENVASDILLDYVLYPYTFRMIDCSCEEFKYEEEGFSLWKTYGYFEAEGKVNIKVKHKFVVWFKYYYETNTYARYLVTIDDEVYYNELNI